MDIFFSEVAGTAMLTLLGCGVVANVSLIKTKGFDGGFLMVSLGWGLAVFTGVYIAYKSGAHLNPAVTVGKLISGSGELAPGVAMNPVNFFTYLIAEFLGAFIGAVLMWLAYKEHFDASDDQATKLGVFSTAPGIRNNMWNIITEMIATSVLVFWILVSGKTPSELGPLAVALVVVAIGACLGGPTGYAINPARDLGPRIAHAVLPIKNKGGSDWSYSWVPVVGPFLGAILAGLAYRLV